MARHEFDKEDLLRDATALIERIELAPMGTRGEHVVAGFRANGALSIFFGADPVYHFNVAGDLRRAYCGGLLYKSLSGRLVSLRREPGDRAVQLVRHELSDAEQRAIAANMHHRLTELAAELAGNELRVVGEVPQDSGVLKRLQEWLRSNPEPSIAARPNVG
jgi:hypothetical protein